LQSKKAGAGNLKLPSLSLQCLFTYHVPRYRQKQRYQSFTRESKIWSGTVWLHGDRSAASKVGQDIREAFKAKTPNGYRVKVLVLEQTINTEINKAYLDLKAVLTQDGCKIISEQAPKQLLVKQGSLWGMTPTGAKKTITLNLASVDTGTQIKYTSKVSSDWQNITLVGCAFAAVLVVVCGWMALDLNAFMTSGRASFWSWLATINGRPDLQVGQNFVNLTVALAVFLSVIIILEIFDIFYVRGRVDSFMKAMFKKLKV
jgi:hypothetical protein